MADAKLGRAVIEVVVDGDQMTAAFAKGEKATQDYTDRVAKTLSNVGQKMTLAVSAPLTGLAVLAVKAASDTAESVDKMGRVFGKAAGTVDAFSKNAAKGLGMSRQRALEATSTFGNFFNTIGLAPEKSAGMSTALVQLAADLASFNNVDPQEALDKLRSGLAGESEPLRAWGILIDAASTKQKALQMGLIGVGEELTQQAAVQARYALIMEQTATAQGNFRDTADGLANSTRITKAELEDAAATLGEHLLPLAKQGIDVVDQLAEAFNGLDKNTQGSIVTIGLYAIALGPILATLGKIITAAKVVGPLLSSPWVLAGAAIAGGIIALGNVRAWATARPGARRRSAICGDQCAGAGQATADRH